MICILINLLCVFDRVGEFVQKRGEREVIYIGGIGDGRKPRHRTTDAGHPVF